ncbi:hypothetical protein AAVH_02662 [Aphelenchoides avenae]|nr:hypothetical protein AAVH_02662 [Aphelenchus avenae]
MPSLPGTLHPSNRDALAWNNKGVLAYGCHAAVVFVDAIRLEVFQTLEQHSAAVNLVSWKPDRSYLKGTDCDLRCASCDIGGQVIVWDVISASSVSTFRNASTVLGEGCSSFALVMWNSGTGEKIWEHKLGFNAFKFAIDPFESSNIALCSAGSNLVLMEDVVVQNPPSGRTTTTSMRRQEKPQKESIIQHVEYHLAYRNIVFVMFSNEVFCVETVSKQVIYTAQVDSSSPLTQILPCSERDAFFMIHQDGFISLRVAKLHHSAERFNARLDYERVCFTEAQRASSKLRVFAARLCPITQSTVAVLFNSGKLMFYQLSPDNCAEMKPYRLTSLSDSIRLTASLENECTSLRLSQYGVLSALSGTVTVVRMRPMESVSSDPDTLSGMHLAAVGTTTGMIHLVNVFNCKIERDLQVHSCPIKCLEWGGSNMIISAAYSSSLSASSTVRNDVFATDIRTGVKKRIRPEADESPIELLRVSFYQYEHKGKEEAPSVNSRCYLALSFRNDPLEIWELKTMRLLRRMSRRCPVIIDMAWSGKHHKVQTVSEKNVYRENLVVLDNENHLYHVVIKGLHVRDGKEVNTEWKSGTALLRCMVWKDDLLAFGDTAGRIGVWDLSRKMCRQTGMSPSSRGPVVKCVFSRLAGDSTLAVQHPTSVVIWDTDTLHQLQQYHHPGLNIVDVDMCGLSPIYVASDGIFRYALDGTRNSPVPERDIPLLVRNGFVRLLEASCHDAELKTEELSRFHVPTDDVSYLQQLVSNTETMALRCAAIYRFLGCSRLSQLIDILQSSVDKHLLPPNLHLFWRPEVYRSRMEDLTRVLVGTCKSADQLEHCIENAIVLGKNDWATFMLLNNDQAVTSSDFRIHAMKACLLSASMSTEECRCLVKLTATNLIASNYVSDGIQLLCLIDQCLDACRYLISQGSWMQSVSYAKMYPKCEARDVVLKYIDYLSSDHSLAVMLLASLGEREKVLNMLRPVANESVLKVVDAVLEEQRRIALTSDALQA